MKKLSGYLLIAGILAFTSCTKTGQQGPAGANGSNGATGPAGPTLTNTITGYVFLYDAYGDRVNTGDSTAYALLYNTANGAKVDSINANSAGLFTGTVQTGTYNIVAKCPGYGNSVTQDVVFSGGTRTNDITFAAIPPLYAASGRDSIGAANVYIKGTLIAPNTRVTTLLVYVGTTSSVNATVPGSYSFVVAGNIAANATTYIIPLPLTTLDAFFSAGATAYVAIYGAAVNYTFGDYTDYASRNIVYTPISATSLNPGSFIMP